jgi:hypothetical protein
MWHGRARRETAEESPHGPVDEWLSDVPDDVMSVIWSVHREMAGRDEAEILTALNAAGITGPADALAGFARRTSATDRSMLPPMVSH